MVPKWSKANQPSGHALIKRMFNIKAKIEEHQSFKKHELLARGCIDTLHSPELFSSKRGGSVSVALPPIVENRKQDDSSLIQFEDILDGGKGQLLISERWYSCVVGQASPCSSR